MCRYDTGEGMIINFDGEVIVSGTTGRPDEIITAEVRPELVREARAHWGVENNIYQLGHRGYVAVKVGLALFTTFFCSQNTS